MASEKETAKSPKHLNCPECDSRDIFTTFEVETVPYGSGSEAVNLTCRVPVRKCKTCGFAFTDDEAEEIRHDVVCRHLKVLTPKEVLGIRTRYGLSRNAFAKLTHIGEASLARWENGYLIQNSANDQLLFLLQFPENAERLLRRELGNSHTNINEQVKGSNSLSSEARVGSGKVFRALTPADKEKRLVGARTFSLRRVTAAPLHN